MKEKLEELENIALSIDKLTASCGEVIGRKSEDGKVINLYLSKLSVRVNDMRLKTLKKEEL